MHYCLYLSSITVPTLFAETVDGLGCSIHHRPLGHPKQPTRLLAPSIGGLCTRLFASIGKKNIQENIPCSH
ncbi:hypothetical protein BS47DRAFT_510875 [Hydnum rufescens UP504]|uniref:Uncharacterized protein n=1 Tax=Hydnum rufescens UP504 TaxID=1448309 RepID=A0A9P6AI33_9AGAM|nr:hypothetical protein BS47DRAFT_510875 [Hydnum rufescens UP504]